MRRILWPRDNPEADLERAETGQERFDACMRRLVALEMALKVASKAERDALLRKAECDVWRVMGWDVISKMEDTIGATIERIVNREGPPTSDDQARVVSWVVEQTGYLARQFGVRSPIPPVIIGRRVFE